MSCPSRDRSGFIGAVIAIVLVVIILLVILALIFLPIRDIKVNESRNAQLPSGVDALDLNLTINAGGLDVQFVDDNTNAITLSVVGHQRSGLLTPNNPVNITWSESTAGSTLSVSSVIKLGGSFGLFTSNDINATLTVAKQLRTALTITNDLGGVRVTTVSGVVLSSLDIKTSTGGASVVMASNVTLDGPFRMEANLGGVDLRWSDARATENASLNMKASTGGVNAVIDQSDPLGANVTFNASASLGGVNLDMNLSGNNSAAVATHANLGDVSVRDRTGFNGTNDRLTSHNYPSVSNFEVACDTNTGGINLSLRYAA